MTNKVRMAFGRRRSLVPVNSTKKVVDTEGSLVDATDSVSVFMVGENQPVTPGVAIVPNGARINGIYVSVFLLGDTGAGAVGSLNWYIACRRSAQSAVTDFPSPGATGDSDVRNQIIHEEKGLAGSLDGTPMVFKGVIAIPRQYRRVRAGDNWFIKIKGLTGYQFCFKTIYKYYQ